MLYILLKLALLSIQTLILLCSIILCCIWVICSSMFLIVVFFISEMISFLSSQDSKFGFGGKKRGLKQNTGVSAADMSGFPGRKMKKLDVRKCDIFLPCIA